LSRTPNIEAAVWDSLGELSLNISIHDVAVQITGRAQRTATFFVGIGGGVASGKSTFAADLAAKLADEAWNVQAISIDGYLKPNAVLLSAGLMHRKGFPESFDVPHLLDDVAQLRAGKPVRVPIYDHAANDVVTGGAPVEPGGILILEGVIALSPPLAPHLDFKIFLDTDLELARKRYEARALRVAAQDSNHPLNTIPPEHRLSVLNTVWIEVNLRNYTDHIAPTMSAADIVITQGT
jgi:type I pantothenate kinase